MWENFSDILVMDCAAKTIESSWYFFIFWVLILMDTLKYFVGFLQEINQKKTLGLVFEFLEKTNNFNKVETVFTDKDFAERAICEEFF